MPRGIVMSLTWRERGEQWRRFHAWELDRLRGEPADLKRALAWMWEAWQLARQHEPAWGGNESLAEHVRSLQRVRAGLARLESHS